MNKKILLVLDGGGSFGAFECGAYKALVPWLQSKGYEIGLIAGASIGAINASLINAYFHENNQGADKLEQIWREELSTNSIPFIPLLSNPFIDSMNGLMTGALLGNKALFTPNYQFWSPFFSSNRLALPFYNTDNMFKFINKHIENTKDNVLLSIRTFELESGTNKNFNNINKKISTNIICASASIPLLFSPKLIKNTHHLDGEMSTHSLISEALKTLKQSINNEKINEYLIVVISPFAQEKEVANSDSLRLTYRLISSLQAQKTNEDIKSYTKFNEYLLFVEKMYKHSKYLEQGELKKSIEFEYKNLLDKKFSYLKFINIQRPNLPNDHLSRDLDFSPQRIDNLINQGIQATKIAIKKYETI